MDEIVQHFGVLCARAEIEGVMHSIVILPFDRKHRKYVEAASILLEKLVDSQMTDPRGQGVNPPLTASVGHLLNQHQFHLKNDCIAGQVSPAAPVKLSVVCRGLFFAEYGVRAWTYI